MNWFAKIKSFLGYDNIYFASGLKKLQKHDLNGAVMEFDRAIQKCASYEAYQNRGAVNYQLNNYEAAKQDFHRAIKLNPHLPEAHLSLGILNTRLENYSQAIACYDEALRIYPTNTIAYTNRGFIKYKLLDLKGALHDFNEAINLNPCNPIAYANRGSVHYKLNNPDAAFFDWKKAKDLGSYEAENMLQTHFAPTTHR